MKYRQIIGIVLFVISLPAISQNNPDKLAIILDLVGNGGLYSVNGEYEIGKSTDYKLNARIGFGYFPIYNVQIVGVPVGFNVLTGAKKNHLELGLGASYIQGMENRHIPAGTFGNTQDWWQQSECIYFVPSIGYRFDNLTGGLIFKVYYSPLIVAHDFFDKKKYLNKLIPVLDGSMTREEYYNYVIGSHIGYPTARNQFVDFGISIGYRF